MAIGGDDYTVQLVNYFMLDSRLPRNREQKTVRPPQQFSKICSARDRQRRVMKLQHVVYCGSHGPQSSLYVLDPAFGFCA